MTKKLLGVVGVDSGQLMICDPCYINSEWGDADFEDIRVYHHKKTKKNFIYSTSSRNIKGKFEEFEHYDKVTSTGKSMNEMIADKDVTEVEQKFKKDLIGDFSYGGVAETTLAGQHQLNYGLGHAGAGVAFTSGYGDGIYEVWGTFNKDGRCMKVEIDMR